LRAVHANPLHAPTRFQSPQSIDGDAAMKPVACSLAGFACAAASHAALPPQYQNAKDLDVMVAFVKQHAVVMSSLRSLDLQAQVIHFGKDCQAVFGRASTPKPPGWAGPADPLEFKNSTCPVG
jgi:hypothetical protein